jgi:hypothetical protein
MTSTVRIPWVPRDDNETYWNEICAWAIERFGLPGNKFQAHANIHYMDFVFKSNKDALMMAIMWNATIVPNEDLTINHVGNLLQ